MKSKVVSLAKLILVAKQMDSSRFIVSVVLARCIQAICSLFLARSCSPGLFRTWKRGATTPKLKLDAALKDRNNSNLAERS